MFPRAAEVVVYRDQKRVLARGNTGYLWTGGLRAEGTAAKAWEYRVEASPQWGRVNSVDLVSGR